MTEMAQVAETANRIKANVARVIVGKDETVELLLVALLCEGHVLLEDVPGIGKTTLAKALAKSLDSSFQRIQFTPDLLPGDITGVSVFNQRTADFEYRAGAALRPDRPGRRDQPRRSAHPGCAPGSHGRAPGDTRRTSCSESWPWPHPCLIWRPRFFGG